MSLSDICDMDILREIPFPYPIYEDNEYRLYLDESSIKLDEEVCCKKCGMKYNDITFGCTYTDYILEVKCDGRVKARDHHVCPEYSYRNDESIEERLFGEDEEEDDGCVFGRVYYMLDENEFRWEDICFDKEISRVMMKAMFNT